MLYLPEFLLIFSFKSLCEIISGADGAYSDFPVKKQMCLFLLLLSSNFVLLLINKKAIPAIHVHVHLYWSQITGSHCEKHSKILTKQLLRAFSFVDCKPFVLT